MNSPQIDQLIEDIIARQVLQFGSFTLKSGRQSPYFFNLGKMCDGVSLHNLGQHYAELLNDYSFDVLFGPAYKGIGLATATAISLSSQYGKNVPWSYNRKEVKDHGEGGQLVGAPLQGKVVIVDDVLTAGTAAQEAIDIIKQQGAQAVALLIFLDRMEPSPAKDISASQHLQQQGLDVLSVLNLDQIIEWLKKQPQAHYQQHAASMEDYLQSLGNKKTS